MTIDEAISHAEEVAEEQEKSCEVYSSLKIHQSGLYERLTAENNEKKCAECAAEHRQLAEWLKDYKELKNSVGAVNLELLKEAQAELEKRGNMLHDAIAELEEAKRLLKSAVDEWHIVCEWGNCGEYCGWYVNGQCSQKWSGEAEALKLIGETNDKP